ncbi:TetR/AcrR family transcriptional regulator [Runella aurantiaca]|uniref:TetR/AcrR family transcriptional regulator n=1 Tax=Runella aurantiaca TaxID=2282308 RepID=A0A369I8V3_9BACT|nr:TetR/AcrR family transcriptional regulator [Runella aurantiaca]RDB05502.1 TetR/AcrR family transcriptional regulator [Runella aurantiaca]
MTEKKELILETALKLFAERGFDTTPTSMIAKEAGVSEGLIFRHFTNKEGLMDAILAMSEERMARHVKSIVALAEPLAKIHATIELPVKLFSEEREFWKLQFSLKWQKKYRGQSYRPSGYYLELVEVITDAFRQLGYAEPEKEVLLLVMLIDGLSNQLMQQPSEAFIEQTLSFLKSKYQLDKLKS